MATELTWYGHATWAIKTGNYNILLDPFLSESPTAPVKPDDLSADFILVSHGHFDHVADVALIANRTNAVVVAVFEIATWFSEKHGVKNTFGMNIGGATQLDFGTVKMTQALHSSQLPDGSYGGNPAGFLLGINDIKLYFACDTALFSDMGLIGNAGIDVAIVPIGDLFTMGPEDSVEAVKLIQPKQVLPSHYNTWPPIQQDANVWSEMVKTKTGAQPIVLLPGQTHSI